MSTVKPIPEGYTAVTAYLSVRGASKAIEFYKKVFGAKELFRMPGPNESIGHAEIQIGDARLMLADEHPAFGNKSPQAYGGTPIGLCLYTESCDQVFAKAVENGAKVVQEPTNQFYGDRSGRIEDPFGFQWTIATHVEDVSPEEMDRRAAAMSSGQK